MKFSLNVQVMMMVLCLVAPELLPAQLRHPVREFYVAPQGSDANPGTKKYPFATLERARDAVRSVRRALPGRACKVLLDNGIYQRDSSFVIGPEESGDSLTPVSYVAVQGALCRIVGGKEVRGFQKVSDAAILALMAPECAGNVYETSLPGNGIREFGKLRARGFGRPMAPSGLELFFNDLPMTLARWPNSGWAVIKDTLGGSRESTFVYEGNRPHRWFRSRDIWLHGYWTWDWADSYTRVAAIDTVRQLITTAAPHGVYGYTPGKRYYALNLLEELDAPGEYYVDRETGMLYFWPPGPIEQARVTASRIEAPLITMRNARWVTVAGLTIECTRGAGVEIIGGDHNTVAGCTIRNIGTVGVSIGRLEPELASRMFDSTLYGGEGGTKNGVQSCEISHCGEGGVILCGGDRATLTPGWNFVDNSHLTDVTRWSRTYRAGVYMWGVGNRVSHCLIHGLPHTAVFFWGNEHLLEYNEVYDVCRETGDAGAFYQGRDWTQRGNVIRYNYFHDVRGVQGQEGFTDVMSVYMDDFASGTTVLGNVFVNGGRTVMIGGGRDNMVENNLFIDGRPAVHVDARGRRGWAAAMYDGENSVLRARLRAVHPDQPPYALWYASLRHILDTDLAVPVGNSIRNNISIGGVWRELQDGLSDSLVLFTGNTVDEDPGFVCMSKGDYRLRADAPVFRSGFSPIPAEKIGLRRDRYRTRIPDRGQPIPGTVVRLSKEKKSTVKNP